MERDGSSRLLGDLVYIVYVELYFNDSKLDILSVPSDQLLDLSEKYISIMKNRSFKQIKGNNIALLKKLRPFKRKGVVEKGKLLADLRTVNVFTIDKFTKTIIGRTVLELDADIITLLSKDVIDKEKQAIIKLHSCNVFFVTQYLGYLTKKLMNNLRNLSKAISIASFIPFGISLYFTISHSQVLPFVIGTFATSLLYTYGKKMIFRELIAYFLKKAFS